MRRLLLILICLSCLGMSCRSSARTRKEIRFASGDFRVVGELTFPEGAGPFPVVLQFVRDAHAAGLLVASFCVGNNVVKAAGLIDLPHGPALFPAKVTLVKERVLLGPRGCGPPPGDGFESAPIKEICDAIARELDAGSLTPKEK